jgi:hypothetical protein
MIVCVDSELISGNHVRWIDNFSKVFRKQIPDSAHVYNSCLWTGTALFVCDDPTISTDLVMQLNGNVLPGMPNDITEFKQEVTDAVSYIVNNSRKHYDDSLVLKYDVRNIPPKIDTKRFPHLAHVVDDPKNTLRNVHPVELTSVNVSSNEGLVSILKDIVNNDGMLSGTCTKYIMLNLDENIYWRALKVHDVLWRVQLMVYVYSICLV